MYAFDTSSSVNSDDFTKIKDFLKSEIKQHTPVSKVALVNFGSDVIIESRLTPNQDSLLKTIESMKKVGGVSKINFAMERIRDDVFTRRLKNLPLRQLILISPIPDNLQNKDAVLKLVKDIRKTDGAKISVVSIGSSKSKNNFDAISSGKDSNLQINTFDKMPSIVDDLFSVIGQNAGMYHYCH